MRPSITPVIGGFFITNIASPNIIPMTLSKRAMTSNNKHSKKGARLSNDKNRTL